MSPEHFLSHLAAGWIHYELPARKGILGIPGNPEQVAHRNITFSFCKFVVAC